MLFHRLNKVWPSKDFGGIGCVEDSRGTSHADTCILQHTPVPSPGGHQGFL